MHRSIDTTYVHIYFRMNDIRLTCKKCAARSENIYLFFYINVEGGLTDLITSTSFNFKGLGIQVTLDNIC